ncbi:ATP-dependent nuclease [Xenorhabdus bharatensis]|uniref:ATP-dependent nuclease n=1 Tax=Xenorhabdus bharatensis TaxID=3136256 RepID=UPI0030F45236
MKISSFKLKNYRRLSDITLTLDDKTTILVGANNSGKTSCIKALYTFLSRRGSMHIKDVPKCNWKEIRRLGQLIEEDIPSNDDEENVFLTNLTQFLPLLDIEINADAKEAYKVRDILPDLEWKGGSLFIRIKYEPKNITELCQEFSKARKLVSEHSKTSLWPKDLCDFLEKGNNFERYLEKKYYILSDDFLQPLSSTVLETLIRIDVISEQRGLGQDDNEIRKGPYTEKHSLNKLLRDYYDNILNPDIFPDPKDITVLGQHQKLEENFSKRLNSQFEKPMSELEVMGYTGIGGNPTVKIAAKISGMDALQRASSIHYHFDEKDAEYIPEHYLGLGYQNLIYLTFRLLEFRDKWMRIGKSAISRNTSETKSELAQIEPIHLVLVEEPEVNLHAQVQRVFVSNAYNVLRNHPELRNKDGKDNSEYYTQLVISTHSSHIINDVDFKELRYFKRISANLLTPMNHTTIANMSELFASPKEELKFVRKHLKLTHCDIFFADGVIFVEGQAERLLIPQFIAEYFPKLTSRYISIIEVSGAHTHKYKDLIENLGMTALVITDIDSVNKDNKKCYPKIKSSQKTNNTTLIKWHPKKENLDELINISSKNHIITTKNSNVYIAYQKATNIEGKKILSRTFEDALILANIKNGFFNKIEKITKAREEFTLNQDVDALCESLFNYIQELKKGEFAFECLFYLSEIADHEEPLDKERVSFTPPEYIKDGLDWLNKKLTPKKRK